MKFKFQIDDIILNNKELNSQYFSNYPWKIINYLYDNESRGYFVTSLDNGRNGLIYEKDASEHSLNKKNKLPLYQTLLEIETND